MMNLVSRLLRRGTPTIAEVRPADAPAIAAVHAASFRRGWGEDEIQRLLLERNIIAQRITAGGKLIGFILSRIVAGAAAGCRGSCSICICAGSPASASGRCFWKSATKMRLPAGYIAARDSRKSAGGRVITRMVRPRWCYVAISADVPTRNHLS